MGEGNLMSFDGLIGLATRRWYLVGLGLAATLALAGAAASEVAPRYETTASVVLLPPPATIGAGGNPYLSMGGLDAAADVTAASLLSAEVQERVAGAGATSTVVRDGGAAAPILLVSVEAPSARAATDVLDLLVDAVPASLAELQASAGVQVGSRLGSELIASSTEPSVSRSPQLRVLLMALAAGLGATVVLTAAIDRLLGRRRVRRAQRAAAVPARPSNPPPGVGSRDRATRSDEPVGQPDVVVASPDEHATPPSSSDLALADRTR